MNKYYELIKKLVQKHPGLVDRQQTLDAQAAGHDLRLALINHEFDELREAVPVTRKRAMVKWVSAARLNLALEIDGHLHMIYPRAVLPDFVIEGRDIDVLVRPDAYNSYEVVEYHLPAHADAEAGA